MPRLIRETFSAIWVDMLALAQDNVCGDGHFMFERCLAFSLSPQRGEGQGEGCGGSFGSDP